jgi:hypothetical protein
MGVVSNILEALRRIGSPTQKSALKRLDDYLQGGIRMSVCGVIAA